MREVYGFRMDCINVTAEEMRERENLTESSFIEKYKKDMQPEVRRIYERRLFLKQMTYTEMENSPDI